MHELILASTSPYRRRMLADAGIRVRCESPGVDERSVIEPDPVRLSETLALAKARAVADRFPGAWVIGADQVAWDGSEIFGKPLDPEDHLRRLCALRGRSHTLFTGFAVLGPGVEVVDHDRAVLTVRGDLSDDELRAYVATGEGSGCAGGYAVEGHGVWLFSEVRGDFFNIMGLPLLRILDVLRQHGWRYTGGER